MESAGVSIEPIATSPPQSLYTMDFLRPVDTTGSEIQLSVPPTVVLPMDTSANGLMNAFFSYFFSSHPFVLPPIHIKSEIAKRRPSLNHLELAIQYIGSFYVNGADTNAYKAALLATLHQIQVSGPRDPFLVQSQLLCAIGLHMAGQEEDASQVLSSCIRLAKDLRMNEHLFSSLPPIIAESFRRTWWEIFVVDGLFSGVHAGYSSELEDEPLKLPLPGEESEYYAGVRCRAAIYIKFFTDISKVCSFCQSVY